eukprot:SAG11_NODE_5983_length_1419_cov_1.203030_3_plen_152_part_01
MQNSLHSHRQYNVSSLRSLLLRRGLAAEPQVHAEHKYRLKNGGTGHLYPGQGSPTQEWQRQLAEGWTGTELPHDMDRGGVPVAAQPSAVPVAAQPSALSVAEPAVAVPQPPAPQVATAVAVPQPPAPQMATIAVQVPPGVQPGQVVQVVGPN